MMKIIFLVLTAFAVIVTLTGCSYATYEVQIRDVVPSNPYSVKFYPMIEARNYGMNFYPEVDTASNEEWIQALVKKYPDYFVDDRAKGVPVVFEWKIDLRLIGRNDNAFATGFTYGLIPLMTSGTFYASITARYPECKEIISGIDGAGYVYKIKAKAVNEPLFMLSIITYPIVAVTMKNDDSVDFDTSLYSGNFIINPFYGYNLCEKNLKLFPLACLQMMNRPLTYEELCVGSKYLPSLKQYLDNLTSAQKEDLIAQQNRKEDIREKFDNQLTKLFNYESGLRELQNQQLQAAVQILQQTQNMVSSISSISASSPTYTPVQPVAPVNVPTGGRIKQKNVQQPKARGPVMANCFKHGQYKSYGRGCPDCFAESNKPRFAE